MATHSSVLAWRIPETEKPSRLPSMGSHRVGHALIVRLAECFQVEVTDKAQHSLTWSWGKVNTLDIRLGVH